LLSTLNDYRARYIVIGGHAVIFHGYLREAKDLDIWIEPSQENAQRVAHALSSIGVFLTADQIARLSQPDLKMPIGSLYTEFLTTVTGLDFEATIGHSVSASEQGVPCHVLNLADLLKNKRLLARESDLEDVANLERLHPMTANPTVDPDARKSGARGSL